LSAVALGLAKHGGRFLDFIPYYFIFMPFSFLDACERGGSPIVENFK